MAPLLVERNTPFDVEFAGWRSNSYTLGRCGWRIAVEQEDFLSPFQGARRTVMFHHPELGLAMIGEGRGEMFEMRRHIDPSGARIGLRDSIGVVVIHRVAMKGDARRPVMLHFQKEPSFYPIDTRPTYMEFGPQEMRDLFQMPFFMELEKPAAQELIVEPDQVGRILELIHKAQEPEQRAIRERNREREKRQLHASIVSMAA